MPLVEFFGALWRDTDQASMNNTAIASAQRMKIVLANSSETERQAIYMCNSGCWT